MNLLDDGAILARVGFESLVWLTLASSLVFAVVWAINRVLPKRAAGVRHALLGLVVLRLLLPPSLTSPVSVLRLADAVERPVQATAFVAAWAHPSSSVMVTGAGETASGASWEVAAMVAWAIGALAVGAALVWRRRRVRRLLAASREVSDARARALLDTWVSRLGIARPVRLLTGTPAIVPFTCGTFRPIVFVPESILRSRDDAMIESAIAHELAHVKRFDDPWLILGQVATSLFFFHPIAWLTVRAMGTEREMAADRLVLARGDLGARSYGRSLLRMLGLRLETTTATATVLPKTTILPKRRIAMRIEAIAKETRPTVPRRRTTWICAAALGLALLPPTVIADQDGDADTPPKGDPVTANASPYVTPAALPGAMATVGATKGFEDLMPGSKLTSGFGMRRHPISGEMLHHDGIDLTTGDESVIYAPQGGVVEVARTGYGENGKMGTVVILDHGSGVKTFYAHLASLSVRAGEGVSAGDPLGFAGNTGQSSGPHLHFELWKDGEKLDPTRYRSVLDDC